MVSPRPVSLEAQAWRDEWLRDQERRGWTEWEAWREAAIRALAPFGWHPDALVDHEDQQSAWARGWSPATWAARLVASKNLQRPQGQEERTA